MNLNKYCTTCGKALLLGEVIHPDLVGWSKEYDKAKSSNLPLPEFPPTRTKCCGISGVIFPPSPELEIPPLPTGIDRMENLDFSSMIKLCNAIDKSPNSIKAYLQLDKIHSLFGPSVYFIDVKAKRHLDGVHKVFQDQIKTQGQIKA